VIGVIQGGLCVLATKKNCLPRAERFAIVDDQAPVRYLSREEFEMLKKRNPGLIEMRAGDIVYLTETPHAG
jgi:hypothetical protein